MQLNELIMINTINKLQPSSDMTVDIANLNDDMIC